MLDGIEMLKFFGDNLDNLVEVIECQRISLGVRLKLKSGDKSASIFMLDSNKGFYQVAYTIFHDGEVIEKTKVMRYPSQKQAERFFMRFLGGHLYKELNRR